MSEMYMRERERGERREREERGERERERRERERERERERYLLLRQPIASNTVERCVVIDLSEFHFWFCFSLSHHRFPQTGEFCLIWCQDHSLSLSH